MDTKALNASLAYTETLKRALDNGMPGGDKAATIGGNQSFADLLHDTAVGVVDASKKSEMMSMQAVAGQAELVDVITAVTNAEVALESVVAVRDRVVQAYQEIMRMPI